MRPAGSFFLASTTPVAWSCCCSLHAFALYSITSWPVGARGAAWFLVLVYWGFWFSPFVSKAQRVSIVILKGGRGGGTAGEEDLYRVEGGKLPRTMSARGHSVVGAVGSRRRKGRAACM